MVRQRPEPVQHERAARILVWLSAAAVVLSLFSLLFTGLGRRSLSFADLLFSALNIPVAPSLASVVLLVLITGGLQRRKRLALWAVAALQVAGAVLSLLDLRHLATDLHAQVPSERMVLHWSYDVANMLSPVLAIAVLWLLWRIRDRFPARMDRGAWLWALAVLVGGLALTVAVAAAWTSAAHASPSLDTALMLWAFAHALGLVSQHAGDGVPAGLGWTVSTFTGLTLAAAAWVFLRAAPRERARTPEQEVRLRELLLQEGGRDSLGYFATRRDKEIVELLGTPVGTEERTGAERPRAEAMVAYRRVGSTAMASGDPVGAPHLDDAVMERFIAECRAQALSPAVLSATKEAARRWTRHGMLAIRMGDEAVLRPSSFRLGTPAMADLRREVEHARRQGLTVRIRRHGSLTDAERHRMITLADDWRHDGPERGFSMALSRLGDPADSEAVLVTAEDAEGTWQGLLSLVPWGLDGLSLDVMRRSPGAPSGVTALMVAELMESAPEHGIRRVSLNFAMFRHIFTAADEVDAGLATRATSQMLSLADRWFQLERLAASNEKFQPEWEPRYLLVDSLLALPSAAWAAMTLEGFTPRWAARRAPLETPLPEYLLHVVVADAADTRAHAVQAPAVRRSDQFQHRLEHLRLLERAGMPGYPVGLPAPSALTDAIRLVEAAAEHAEDGTDAVEAADAEQRESVRVAGRVERIREHGAVVFADLVSGRDRLQVLLDQSVLGSEPLDLWRRAVDTGDLVQITGHPGASQRGTPSLVAAAWVMAAKSLHPIPFGGLQDPQARLRHRSLDLIVHPREAGLLKARSTVVDAVRRQLLAEGGQEVETPILQTVHGGANARPFRTHINAYDADLVLRIAPELALKRLLIGGLGPIFEIGRNFRNEGADATHNPEFTSLEAYWPYGDYTSMRHLTEQLIKAAARALYGAEVLPLRDVRTGAAADGTPAEQLPVDPARRLAALLTDVSEPWPAVPMSSAVSEAVGREVSVGSSVEELREIAAEHGVELREEMGAGAILEELYGKLVEPRTIRPTFYTDFPAETSPLTAPHRSQEGLVERWDLVVGGMELGTAYSELTDPLDQRERFTQQSVKAAAGDPEAMEIDEDFLQALEMGMPPSGGLGIGMDRLVMLLTDTSIREILAFPFVRPQR